MAEFLEFGAAVYVQSWQNLRAAIETELEIS